MVVVVLDMVAHHHTNPHHTVSVVEQVLLVV